jgi:hypothetical protein
MITGLPSLRLLPDAPVPDGRTVLLGSPATTAGDPWAQAASTAFHTSYQPDRTELRETRRRVKVIGRLPGERSCLSLV